MAAKKSKNSSKSSSKSTTKKNNKTTKQTTTKRKVTEQVNENVTVQKETTPSPQPKKKRVTLSIFSKKFLIGMTLCTFSAAAGAGIAYGTVAAVNASNNTSSVTNSVSLYTTNGDAISMTIGTNSTQKYIVPEDNLPTLNNYRSSNANYLTLSLVFSTLEFTFTSETQIAKNSIVFNLNLISDVANAASTSLTFTLTHDALTVPANSTLSFTNLVFDFKVDIATNGAISLTKSTTENSTLKVGKINIK